MALMADSDPFLTFLDAHICEPADQMQPDRRLMQYESIRNAIDLRQRDSAFQLFGALRHRYQLNPQLTELQIAEFEQQRSIRLPVSMISMREIGALSKYGLTPAYFNQIQNLFPVPRIMVPQHIDFRPTQKKCIR